ncbi:hypothetical protein HETIRDRAFT_108301 [Heterobasidion irregulare TC 32-1]|uniref:Uncharacterized protein n=1 Tax=Heterobasidion irregulare (strain TC 32-1) TaxID=747525 RepID=W4JQ97_HETIT|nr:uncharacterized protein HETIRDRAFT_108301 [Heterobasidion irregulare TC 32-1]ETW75051.1 hypothetical protein HETIRDRAFT_108301 [Heterobasidion irregulare TC 32-1]
MNFEGVEVAHFFPLAWFDMSSEVKDLKGEATHDALKKSYDSSENGILLRKGIHDHQFGISNGAIYRFEKSGTSSLSNISPDLKQPVKDAPPRPDSDDPPRPDSDDSSRSDSNDPPHVPDLNQDFLDLHHKIGVLLNVAGGGTRFSRLREHRCIRARHEPTKARYRNTHRLAPIPPRRSLGQEHPEALRARPADASMKEAPPPTASDRTVGRRAARNLEGLRGARLTRWRHRSRVQNRRRTPEAPFAPEVKWTRASVRPKGKGQMWDPRRAHARASPSSPEFGFRARSTLRFHVGKRAGSIRCSHRKKQAQASASRTPHPCRRVAAQ